MKRFYIYIIVSLVALSIGAAEIHDAIKRDINVAAANNHEYPFLTNNPPAETPAPAGYEPFYLSHYGRHGSRWLIGYGQYDNAIKQLECAQLNGHLTKLGENTLATLRLIRTNAEGHSGALSLKGAHQHQAIASRMFKKYRAIFAGKATVDAKSTIVKRSIESMDNELATLKQLNPELNIVRAEGKENMWFLNYTDSVAIEFRKPIRAGLKKTMDERMDTRRFMAQLVDDAQFVADSLNAPTFLNNMWAIASNQQSEYTDVSLYHLFKPEDTFPIWEYYNLVWYTGYGPYAPVKGRGMYSQANLLQDFISRADEAIAGNGTAANLRFGHDTVVMPLVALMGLDGYGEETADIDSVATFWNYGKAIPMGANVQLVFYRNASGDVLVKALLNEREVSLPLTPVAYPYYRWTDVRAYFVSRTIVPAL